MGVWTIWSHLDTTCFGEECTVTCFNAEAMACLLPAACRVSHKHWKWVVGGFSMGCGQLIWNPRCRYADVPRQSAGQWYSSVQAAWSAQNLLRHLNRCHSWRKCPSCKESVMISLLNLTGFNNKPLPNLQHLLACCIPIERCLEKICQNYVSRSWGLLDTWPNWCELISQKFQPWAPQNLCFLTWDNSQR